MREDRRVQRLLRAMLLVSYVSVTVAPVPVSAAAEPGRDSPATREATKAFDARNYTAVVAELLPLARAKALPQSELLAAYDLLARAYVRLGFIETGKAWFARLLATDRAWTPASPMEPFEKAVFEQAARFADDAVTARRTILEPPVTHEALVPIEPGGGRGLITIVLGLVSSAAALYYFTKNDNIGWNQSPHDLPNPP